MSFYLGAELPAQDRLGGHSTEQVVKLDRALCAVVGRVRPDALAVGGGGRGDLGRDGGVEHGRVHPVVRLIFRQQQPVQCVPSINGLPMQVVVFLGLGGLTRARAREKRGKMVRKEPSCRG